MRHGLAVGCCWEGEGKELSKKGFIRQAAAQYEHICIASETGQFPNCTEAFVGHKVVTNYLSDSWLYTIYKLLHCAAHLESAGAGSLWPHLC